MIVWIVNADTGSDKTSVRAVFATEEAARAEAEKCDGFVEDWIVIGLGYGTLKK
jgi:hypothetical protein